MADTLREWYRSKWGSRYFYYKAHTELILSYDEWMTRYCGASADLPISAPDEEFLEDRLSDYCVPLRHS